MRPAKTEVENRLLSVLIADNAALGTTLDFPPMFAPVLGKTGVFYTERVMAEVKTKTLQLWLIEQPENNVGWDCYDSAIVVASDADAARRIHPGGGQRWFEDRGWVYDLGHAGSGSGWTTPNMVTAKPVGVAAEGLDEGAVICASFNAG